MYDQTNALNTAFAKITLSNSYMFRYRGTILRQSTRTKENKPKTLN
jgi:hypothetical protein